MEEAPQTHTLNSKMFYYKCFYFFNFWNIHTMEQVQGFKTAHGDWVSVHRDILALTVQKSVCVAKQTLPVAFLSSAK